MVLGKNHGLQKSPENSPFKIRSTGIITGANLRKTSEPDPDKRKASKAAEASKKKGEK